MQRSLLPLLNIARVAATGAGDLLRSKREQLKEVNFALANDLKTEADEAAEALLRTALGATGLPIIGEEQGGDSSLTSGDTPYWCIDPLDGTINYVGGVPFCAVSVGLMQGLTPLLGIVHDFNRDETFWAYLGGGAWLNDTRLTAVYATSLKEGIMADCRSTIPAEDIKSYLVNRIYGSAALNMCYVACGRMVGYREGDPIKKGPISLWDAAAATCLLKELGYSYDLAVGPDLKIAMHTTRLTPPTTKSAPELGR
jgi:myo-inositol-1(or 4)-monophosphatase